MKKVAIFTTFYVVTSGYSLIAVCENQIRMLLDHGYDPTILVQDGPYQEDADGNPVESPPFEQVPPPSVWNEQTVNLKPIIPVLKLSEKVADDFEDRMQAITSALAEGLEDVEVCITHDVILQKFYKEHNVAMRRYAQTRPDLLWLHWIHSCPMPANVNEYPGNCRYIPPPGYIVYPNGSDIGLVCATYRLGSQSWRAKVSRTAHSIDPLLAWNYDKMTRDLATKADLLGGEVVAIYPARLDTGKQPEKIIRLMAGVKGAGYAPRLLIVDWQSSGERFQKYIDELLKLAKSLDLENEVNFTSRIDDRCSQGIPRQNVLELMDLSNIYVHPSSVETYSLTVHEAALRGCLLVLNFDFPPMRELYGESAIYFDFGSDRHPREYHPDEQAFWNDEARRLIAEMKQNRALMAKTKARQEWTPQAMWREFEPLLYLMPIGE